MKKQIELFTTVLLITTMLFFMAIPLNAADHGEPPLLRDDPASNIGDLYAFRNPNDDSQLVFVLTFNPGIPAGTTVVPFVENIEYVFNIDNEPTEDPEDIRARIQIEVEFENGGMDIKSDAEITAAFAGLRDDPFLPNENNINALVIQVPVDELVEDEFEDGSTLLIWAHTETSGLMGKKQDSAGRPGIPGILGDPTIDADEFNQTEPKDHVKKFGEQGGELPDVLTLDLDVPDGFPNGRRLEDEPAGGPNNVPFLEDFPFLAGPN